MIVCFAAFGANLGDPAASIRKAASMLTNCSSIFHFHLSSLYWTAPVSSIPQPDFVNAACQFKTTLAPFDLLTLCCSIERQLGKEPKPKEAPRLIDIDILIYGSSQLETDQLELPHPRLLERPFVLRPLADLCSEIALPGRGSIDIESLLFGEMWDTVHQYKEYGGGR
jgi:2-amino-4-hydroxy-6-hydroxymethyldihydropteridine diphosphokinase